MNEYFFIIYISRGSLLICENVNFVSISMKAKVKLGGFDRVIEIIAVYIENISQIIKKKICVFY